MDRAVLNDSNLTNANLSRAILTRSVLQIISVAPPDILKMLRAAAKDLAVPKSIDSIRCMEINETLAMCRSDLGGAKISGTDFSNALVDKTQQIVSFLPGHLDCFTIQERPVQLVWRPYALVASSTTPDLSWYNQGCTCQNMRSSGVHKLSFGRDSDPQLATTALEESGEAGLRTDDKG